jgi:hypothetical protein
VTVCVVGCSVALIEMPGAGSSTLTTALGGSCDLPAVTKGSSTLSVVAILAAGASGDLGSGRGDTVALISTLGDGVDAATVAVAGATRTPDRIEGATETTEAAVAVERTDAPPRRDGAATDIDAPIAAGAKIIVSASPDSSPSAV